MTKELLLRIQKQKFQNSHTHIDTVFDLLKHFAKLLVKCFRTADAIGRPVVTGREEMAGARGQVVDWQGSSGRVRVHGELWQARGPTGLVPEQIVEVREIQGLTAEVTPAREEITP